MKSTAYHLQSIMHVKSLITSTESINRVDPCRNEILYRHYSLGI